MKRLFAVFAALLAFATTARADNDTPVSVDQFPAQAQQFIQQYFPDTKVAFAKKESEFLWWGVSYEVIFVDGAKIEFDGDGLWEKVDCKYSAVPAGIVPPQILSQLATSHPGVSVIRIERDRREYEVKLANRIELTFNRRFVLVDYDD